MKFRWTTILRAQEGEREIEIEIYVHVHRNCRLSVVVPVYDQ